MQARSYPYKIINLGNQGVGKTQFINLITGAKAYSEKYISTFGPDPLLTKIKIELSEDESAAYKSISPRLQIWDTSGKSEMKDINNAFFTGAKAFILHYDITDITSLAAIPRHLHAIKKQLNVATNIYLIGNKADLEEQRQVETQNAIDVAKDLDLIFLGECSAKTGFNTTHAIKQVAKQIELQENKTTHSQSPKTTKTRSPLGLQIAVAALIALPLLGIAIIAWPTLIAAPVIIGAAASLHLSAAILTGAGITLAIGTFATAIAALLKRPLTYLANPQAEPTQAQKHQKSSTASTLVTLKDDNAQPLTNSFFDKPITELPERSVSSILLPDSDEDSYEASYEDDVVLTELDQDKPLKLTS